MVHTTPTGRRFREVKSKFISRICNKCDLVDLGNDCNIYSNGGLIKLKSMCKVGYYYKEIKK